MQHLAVWHVAPWQESAWATSSSVTRQHPGETHVGIWSRELPKARVPDCDGEESLHDEEEEDPRKSHLEKRRGVVVGYTSQRRLGGGQRVISSQAQADRASLRWQVASRSAVPAEEPSSESSPGAAYRGNAKPGGADGRSGAHHSQAPWLENERHCSARRSRVRRPGHVPLMEPTGGPVRPMDRAARRMGPSCCGKGKLRCGSRAEVPGRLLRIDVPRGSRDFTRASSWWVVRRQPHAWTCSTWCGRSLMALADPSGGHS